MNRILFSLLLLAFLSSCSDIENVEVKEGNVVTESYDRRKSDFAKQGTYKRFSPEGKLLEQSEYDNNLLHGKQSFFYPNGQVLESVHYTNGTHNGTYQTFFENGKVELEGQYANGALEGEFKVHYESGQVKEILTYKNNEEVGAFKEYHDNGNIKTEGAYNGADPDTNIAVEHGELKKYDEKGEHYQTMDCTNGRCITTWKKEGVEINVE